MLLPAPRRRSIPFPALLAVSALAIWFVLRLALLLDGGLRHMSSSQAGIAVVRGGCFDLATLAYLIAPWLVLSAALPNRWRASRVAGAARWAAIAGWVAWLVFTAVAEHTFWREFRTRFNFIAVDYLIYTTEVIGNIRESYPVNWILAGVAAFTVGVVVVLRRWLSFSTKPHTRWRRTALTVLSAALPAAAWISADVDAMVATGNAYADELSGNGLFTLTAAMRRNELDYDRFYQTLPQEEADRILADLGVGRSPLSGAGSEAPRPPKSRNGSDPFLLRRPQNVVLITVESLSASYLGAYGGEQGLTPNLDRLAAGGLRFDRLFATGTRTVRGLEALSLGTPPVPGQAIVRRPGNEHLATIGELLAAQGWATLFVYGGYGYFDNMNAYFAGNDYRVLDRTDFAGKPVFENVWGVADEELFKHALEALDETVRGGKPFFAHLLTTSNHRPFTYPDGRIDIPSPGGRKGAVKYTDHAIGRFVEEARHRPWFGDTLFVVVADHCASVAGKTRLPVSRYRIPAFFYGPELVRPGVQRGVASQIDLAPTLLDALGARGSEEFFGRSLLDPDAPERAFVSNYQELGYLKGGVLTVLAPKERVEAYRIDPETFVAEPTAPNPTLTAEAIAYYQTASRAFKRGALRRPEAVSAR